MSSSGDAINSRQANTTQCSLANQDQPPAVPVQRQVGHFGRSFHETHPLCTFAFSGDHNAHVARFRCYAERTHTLTTGVRRNVRHFLVVRSLCRVLVWVARPLASQAAGSSPMVVLRFGFVRSFGWCAVGTFGLPQPAFCLGVLRGVLAAVCCQCFIWRTGVLVRRRASNACFIRHSSRSGLMPHPQGFCTVSPPIRSKSAVLRGANAQLGFERVVHVAWWSRQCPAGQHCVGLEPCVQHAVRALGIAPAGAWPRAGGHFAARGSRATRTASRIAFTTASGFSSGMPWPLSTQTCLAPGYKLAMSARLRLASSASADDAFMG